MKKKIILSVILAGVVAASCSCGNSNMKHNKDSATEEAAVSAEAESSGPQVTQILVSGAGDVTLGSDEGQPTDLNFDTMYEEVSDPSYFLSGVSSVFGSDDMTLVNFEGTLSTQGERQDKTFAFRGNPEYVKILTEGSVEAVAFANNHCQDYGEVSYTDTMKYLDEAGIVYSSFDIVGMYEAQGKKLGMISVSQLRGNDQAKELITRGVAKLREQDADAIIVSIHGGVEHEYSVSSEMEDVAHFAVDEGADLVLCHHPHVLQGVEKYNNVYIAYSLGNFCFGGNTNPGDKNTMIFQKTFTFVDDALVLDDAVKAIPCTVSSTSERNDYQPTLKEGDALAEGIETLNDYSEAYGVVFAADGTIESVNGAAGFVPDATTALTAQTRAKGTASPAAAATDAEGTDTESTGTQTDAAGTATDTTATDAADTTTDTTATDAAGTTTDTTATDTTATTDAATDSSAGSSSGVPDASVGTGLTAGTDTEPAAGTAATDNAATGSATTDTATTEGSKDSTGSSSTKKGLMRHRDLLKSDDKIFALQ